MFLTKVLGNIRRRRPSAELFAEAHPKVVCVGGSEQFPMMPLHYLGWRRELLATEPAPGAANVHDIYRLHVLSGSSCDAVFFAHRLKNYPLQEAGPILNGFRHLVRPGGFVHIVVPDVVALVRHMVSAGKDLEDVAYVSPAGPIRFHDVLFGGAYGPSGLNERPADFHHSGYSRKVLSRVLFDNGFIFSHVTEDAEAFELHAIAAPHPIEERFKLMMGLT